MMGLSTIVSVSLLALRLFSLPSLAAPSPSPLAQPASADVSAASAWWLASIPRQGKPAFGGGNYKVFRNVKDYGAKGDGNSDDTVAINNAISDGQRCGQGCDSSTTSPALVYFPPGTYVVSKPIVQLYYTQLVGDAIDPPTLKASSNFAGIAVVDADPYGDWGNNWYTNQNNFFRQVRNFKIDLKGLPKNTGTGIHWQVAQATSLQNIEFNMIEDKSSDNKQQGIFMDNGSGGFMTDLTFNGGGIGAFFGNQQFTTRNLKFNNCKTAIKMNWNWVWTFHGISVNNCDVGIDMASQGDVQAVGAVIVADSTFSNTPTGIVAIYNPDQSYTNGTLILDNVDFSQNVPVAVQDGVSKQTLLVGKTRIGSWAQGRSYSNGNGKAVQGPRDVVSKPDALIDGSGRIVSRSKPQYTDVDASRFVSVKSKGAKGDGSTDDTAAIQAVFDNVAPDQVVYFDHGAYLVTDTVRVPKNVKVVGEIWPLILAGGNGNFKDMANPKPVFQIGQPGDVGNVEMQDLIFETQGPQPGAILIQVNVAGESKGSAALWDVHARVGGSAGTQLQSDKCTKTPNSQTSPNPNCIGAFLLLHVTPSASVYVENAWYWVADHELDLSDHNQISLYNGRGVLIESKKGAWLWGTSSEHNQLYNYQTSNSQNVFMGLIQTETAYMQGNPDARVPFTANSRFFDPEFSDCSGPRCARTWGLRVQNSGNILVYGAGLYNFFDNYASQCADSNNCQDSIVSIEKSRVTIIGLNTKASTSMVKLNGESVVKDSENRNTFGAAIAAFESS